MKSRIRFVLPFVLLGAGPALARDNQEFPVQWKVGTTYVQSMDMAQEMTMPGGQGGMQTQLTMKVRAVPQKGSKEGTTEVTMTYDSADMSLTMTMKDPSTQQAMTLPMKTKVSNTLKAQAEK